MSSDFVRDMRLALEVTNDEKYKADDKHQDRKFVFCCKKPDDVKPDDVDSVYALKLIDESAGEVRFKVSKCSTVFFAAVHITKFNIIHSGLVVENDFEVTFNGATTTYKSGHLVAHALFVAGTSDTKVLVAMCGTREAAFNELASVAASKNAPYYTRAMSPGFVSSTPCFTLVEKLRKEIGKSFDKHWRNRLTEDKEGSVEALGDDVTNCAIFAGCIFYSLAPSDDKQEIAVKGTLKVFKELGIEESKVKPYVSAIKK